MKIKVQTTVGGVTFYIDVDESKEMEALHKAIVLGNPPKWCNVCKNSQYFRLESNKDKDGNVYVNVRCLGKGCGCTAKLGQYKAGGYFWHPFEKYTPKGQSDNQDAGAPPVEGYSQANDGQPWEE